MIELSHMTAQEVYDTSVRQMMKQGWKQSVDKSGVCRYRHGKLRCAAGALIPDSEYRKLFEGLTWAGLGTNHDGAHFHLVTDLQGAHDYGTSVDEMQDKFLTVALNHDLCPIVL